MHTCCRLIHGHVVVPGDEQPKCIMTLSSACFESSTDSCLQLHAAIHILCENLHPLLVIDHSCGLTRVWLFEWLPDLSVAVLSFDNAGLCDTSTQWTSGAARCQPERGPGQR